jgi:hypothetical protein
VEEQLALQQGAVEGAGVEDLVGDGGSIAGDVGGLNGADEGW